ncbi:TIGR03089 family protein [Micromonospora peucetia]|uniref:TIGR03089 family protein n=1 Tax=Micromonospora peucetia TaxID=47871 RepID=A0A1C6UNU8_9ACTN|nr:TIGR03089 family protein [Micromonospora peucetia]MCX4387099.1 TIGR03089 family protein [Micromonospora peucetia]WSA34462.1 TIGR03089 family protein [Micromonospora peucetia]SCL55593.1 TIGR03089 family protein [Micromonospora peucetia]
MNLTDALVRDPLTGGRAAEVDRPLLTYLDDATGERVDLTATELGSWAARAAGLLREGCGLGVGDRAAVLLPAHWQTAAVLLGAWSAGVAVSFQPRATAGLPRLGPGADGPFDAVFVSAERLDDWLEDVPEARHRYVLGLGAAPPREVPLGYLDWFAEVGRHTDALPASAPLTSTDAASPDGTSYREWGSVALAVAERLDLRAGDRLLVDVAEHEQPVYWLLAPLAVGASVVLCANLDPATLDARVAAEHVTRVL